MTASGACGSSRVNSFCGDLVMYLDFLFIDCHSKLVKPFFLCGLIEGGLLKSHSMNLATVKVKAEVSIILVATASTLWDFVTHLCTAS